MKIRKGFFNLFGFLLLAMLCGGSYFFMYKNTEEISGQKVTKGGTFTEKQIPSAADISFTPSENSVLVMDGDKVIQTLTLNEEAIAALTLELPYINDQKFLLDQDVNFDGNKDVALMTGIGYGGVNIFYDYYIYNPTARQLEKSDVLVGISNPEVDIATKKITSSFKSGPEWYTQSFQWNGSIHIETGRIPEENL